MEPGDSGCGGGVCPRGQKKPGAGRWGTPAPVTLPPNAASPLEGPRKDVPGRLFCFGQRNLAVKDLPPPFAKGQGRVDCFGGFHEGIFEHAALIYAHSSTNRMSWPLGGSGGRKEYRRKE